MKLHCPQCNQKFHLSDYRVDDRNVYFFCDRCGHRIVVSQEKESWTRFRVFANRVLTIADLPDGITFSFNIKSLFTSYLFLLIISVTVVLAGTFFYLARDLFVSSPIRAYAMAIFVFLAINYLWYMMLYFISKNTISLIEHHENRHFFHDMNIAETRHDLFLVLVLSVVTPLILILVVTPLGFMGKFSIAYAGVMNPIIFSVTAVVLLADLFKNIFIGFISTRSRSLKYSMTEFIRFFLVEHINIPIYMAAVMVISFITLVVEVVVIVLGFSLILPSVISISITPILKSLLAGNIEPVVSALLSLDFNGAVILFIITSSVVLSLFTAYFITHLQVLVTSSLYIMEKDPGKSVNRGIALIVTGGILVVFIAAIFSGLF